jgi:hypothetical protein
MLSPAKWFYRIARATVGLKVVRFSGLSNSAQKPAVQSSREEWLSMFSICFLHRLVATIGGGGRDFAFMLVNMR